MALAVFSSRLVSPPMICPSIIQRFYRARFSVAILGVIVHGRQPESALPSECAILTLLADGPCYSLPTLSFRLFLFLPAQQSLAQVTDIETERLADVLKREKVRLVLGDKPFLRL